MHPAAACRIEKEQHPERFCRVPACLWRIVQRDGSANPCRNHPLPPVPPTPPTLTPRACNVCHTPAASRVEVRTATQRWVVCARCAVSMAIDCAAREAVCRIVAFVVAPESAFVASDGWYAPNVADVTAHQRAIDARAERFAMRVQAVIARRMAIASSRSREIAA